MCWQEAGSRKQRRETNLNSLEGRGNLNVSFKKTLLCFTSTHLQPIPIPNLIELLTQSSVPQLILKGSSSSGEVAARRILVRDHFFSSGRLQPGFHHIPPTPRSSPGCQRVNAHLLLRHSHTHFPSPSGDVAVFAGGWVVGCRGSE